MRKDLLNFVFTARMTVDYIYTYIYNILNMKFIFDNYIENVNLTLP